jgi:hypothetical protein
MRFDGTNFVSNQLKKKKNATNEDEEVFLGLNYALRHEYVWESVDKSTHCYARQ